MDSFRKPRPDVPILPPRALYRKVPKRKKIIRPKGSRKRRKGKPKGRPKTTQSPFITESEARAQVARETGLRQIALEQSDKSLQNERERLRLQTAVAQEEVRYRGLLLRREDIQREEDREERREERREDRRRGLPQVIQFRETSPETDEGSIRSPLSEATPFPSPRRAEDKERARAFARASSESGIRLSPSSSPTIVELEQSIEARPETALLGEQGRDISPRARLTAGGGSVADQRERLLKTISITPRPRPEEEGEELISQESRDISERAATDFSERLRELRSRQQTPLLSSPQAAAVREKISRGILLQQEEQVGGGSARPVSISVRPQSQKRPTTPERPKRRSTTPERPKRTTTKEFASARQQLAEGIAEPQPEPEPEPESEEKESSQTIDFDTAINPIRKEGKKITVDDLYIEVLSDVNKNLPAGKRFAVRSVPSITGTGKGNTTKFNIFKEGFSNRGDPQFTADDAVIEKALREGKIRFTIG